MREDELRGFFGTDYSENCVEHLIHDLNDIIIEYRNGIYRVKDMQSKFFEFQNGFRVTSNNTKEANRVFFFGRCDFLGAYVSDDKTVEYYFKEELLKRKLPYDVINGGLWTPDIMLDMPSFFERVYMNRMYMNKYHKDDVIIIEMPKVMQFFLRRDRELQGKCLPVVWNGKICNKVGETKNNHFNWLDCYLHCNGLINKIIPSLTVGKKEKRYNLSKYGRCSVFCLRFIV